ncbi:S8 family peptidase [Natronorubrum daqingense]|uniref:S8 family peptidase n=1 Tax=Natronorubrum daqingense TaxID=588898 RepID=UPI00143C0CF7|nr:S8 family serine peptidase [Natronorubrum daqingense]
MEEHGEKRAIINFDRPDEYYGPCETRSEKIAELKECCNSTHAPLKDFISSTAGIELLSDHWAGSTATVRIDFNTFDVDDLEDVDYVKSVVVDDGTLKINSDDGADTYLPGDVDWSLEQTQVHEFWTEYGARGENVKVAVTDTGIDPDHEALELYTDDPDDETYPGGWAEFDLDGNEIEDSEPWYDFWHGIEVSGPIKGKPPESADEEYMGVAPECDLMMVKMNDPDETDTTTHSAMIAALEWCLENGADIINSSWGNYARQSPPYELDLYYDIFQDALDMNCISVGSSGNTDEGGEIGPAPGSYYNAISVGGVEESGEMYGSSTGRTIEESDWDEYPDEWPDEYIIPDITAGGRNVPTTTEDDEYGTASGTSFAAPIVTGHIALLLSYSRTQTESDADINDIISALKGTAWKPDDWSDDDFEDGSEEAGEHDTRYGCGIAKVLDAQEKLRDMRSITGEVIFNSIPTNDAKVYVIDRNSNDLAGVLEPSEGEFRYEGGSSDDSYHIGVVADDD